MGFLNFVQRNRHALNNELAGSDLNWYFSATTTSLYRSITPILAANAHGRTLDAGAGHMQFRTLILRYASSYESFDIEARTGSVDHLGDIQDMTGIPNDQYDTVFCNQVIEHLPFPDKALHELFRILKPGGTLILAAPHLSRYHEEPHDYFRYTGYGFTSLLERAGFREIRIFTSGGIFCFLAHQISTILLALFWGIPLLKWIVFGLNRIILIELPILLDTLLGTGKKFPLNIIGVGKKSFRE